MSGALVACPDGAFEGGDGETGGPDTLFVDILIVDIVDAADTPDSAADTAATDSGGDTDAGPPCEGCVGAPCDENADCLSGYCLPGPDGRQCTESCVESCPEGFGCRPISTGGADVAFVCVYDHLAFCLPCDDASDCVDPLNPGAATLCHAEADGSGSFCRTPCDDDGD